MNNIISFVGRGRPVASQPQSRALPLSDIPKSDDTLFIDAARQEVHYIAILTALTCSTLNYNYQFDTWRPSKEFMRFLPPEPIILPILFRRWSNLNPTPGVTHLFDHYASYLADAKRLVRSVYASPDGKPRAAQIDEVVSTWQAVASATLLALYEIDRIMDDDADEQQIRSELADLLIAVRDGNSPALVDGRPIMPTWAQRRRHRRVLVNMNATARYRGQSHAVLLVNVSQGGIGLDFMSGVKIGEFVAVTLPSGRRLLGSVTWSNGSRAGLVLSSELAADDPLISSG